MMASAWNLNQFPRNIPTYSIPTKHSYLFNSHETFLLIHPHWPHRPGIPTYFHPILHFFYSQTRRDTYISICVEAGVNWKSILQWVVIASLIDTNSSLILSSLLFFVKLRCQLRSGKMQLAEVLHLFNIYQFNVEF